MGNVLNTCFPYRAHFKRRARLSDLSTCSSIILFYFFFFFIPSPTPLTPSSRRSPRRLIYRDSFLFTTRYRCSALYTPPSFSFLNPFFSPCNSCRYLSNGWFESCLGRSGGRWDEKLHGQIFFRPRSIYYSRRKFYNRFVIRIYWLSILYEA